MSTRKFKGTPAQMLFALKIVVSNALLFVDKIKEVRPKWNEAYFHSLQNDIHCILVKDFEIDDTTTLVEKMEHLSLVEAKIKTILQQIKIQLDFDFRKDTYRYCNLIGLLGYTQNMRVEGLSQSNLLMLTQRFCSNITPEIETEFVDAGMNPMLINDANQVGNEFLALVVEQGAIGRTLGYLNSEMGKLLADIYEEVISISSILETLLPDAPELDTISYPRALAEVGYVERPKQERSPSTTTRRKRRRR
jgi:hypothetical protein